jgi:exodeoxyribonuclease V alpha subunit
MDSFQGRIVRVIYKAPAEVGDFYIFSMETEDKDEVSVKGTTIFKLTSDMVVNIRGVMDSYKGSPQIQASFLGPHVPISDAGARGWLTTLPVDGFGHASSRKLLQHYPDDLNVRLSSVADIKAAGIKEKVAEALADAWSILSMPNEVLELFSIEGVSVKMATRIIEVYGSRLQEVLKNNPWDIARTVRGVGFKIADAIAEKTGADLKSDCRIHALVYHIVEHDLSNKGHTLMSMDSLLKVARGMGFYNEDRISGVVEAMISDDRSGVCREEITGLIGGVRTVRSEMILGQNLLRLMAAGDFFQDDADLDARIDAAEAALKISLDPSQRAAVRCSLKMPVSVITGGPGTGKSTIQAVIVKVLEAIPDEGILRLAPTGRAARRLAEATGGAASTIHRALKFDPIEQGFVYCKGNPLPHTTILIDEYSMVDIELSLSLLSAVSTGTRVVIVGDDKQLQSVGPGQVLADIIRSGVVPVSRLTSVHDRRKRAALSKLPLPSQTGKCLNSISATLSSFLRWARIALKMKCFAWWKRRCRSLGMTTQTTC